MNREKSRVFSAKLAFVTAVMLCLSGCAAGPSASAFQNPVSSAADRTAAQVLAPSGRLRVGVYGGSPSSMVRSLPSGKVVGVAHDLGTALATQLGVAVQVVEFDRLALVLEALKTGAIDFTFTNATEVRAREVDFTTPMLQLELGFLVPQDTRIRSLADVDQSGVRIGVSQGNSSQNALPRLLKAATLVPASSLDVAQRLMRDKAIEVFATNNGILFELADAMPGASVLDGRWGFENMAIAVPKGRLVAMPYLNQFAQRTLGNGQLQAIVARAGLRGAVVAIAKTE